GSNHHHPVQPEGVDQARRATSGSVVERAVLCIRRPITAWQRDCDTARVRNSIHPAVPPRASAYRADPGSHIGTHCEEPSAKHGRTGTEDCGRDQQHQQCKMVSRISPCSSDGIGLYRPDNVG
ncbi:TPA: hypothetical protein N0F65_007473, partial [Lagenidium giganteum]